jgi:hypothetical protein
MGKLEEVNGIYRKLQREISEILFSEQKNKLTKINKLSTAATGKAKKWADKYVDNVFMQSYMSTKNKLERLKLKKKRTVQKLSFIEQRQAGLYRRFEYIHNSIMFFVSEFIKQFMKTNDFIEAEVQSYSNPVSFRRTALGEETKKEVRKGLNVLKRFTRTGYLYRATLSRGEIERNLKKMFQRMFGDIDFIAITMKNGRVRRYQLKTYVNMLARTEMRYITTQAAKRTLQEWEHDLIRVVPEFVGNCTTKICFDYAGQVFSLSGKSKEYPVLDQEPPFHPYCIHSITPVTPESIALDKEREKAA